MAEVAQVAQVVEVDFITVVQETEIAMVRAFFRADRADKFRPVLNWRGLVDNYFLFVFDEFLKLSFLEFFSVSFSEWNCFVPSI